MRSRADTREGTRLGSKGATFPRLPRAPGRRRSLSGRGRSSGSWTQDGVRPPYCSPLPGQCPVLMAKVVSTYRCGAAPASTRGSYRLPFQTYRSIKIKRYVPWRAGHYAGPGAGSSVGEAASGILPTSASRLAEGPREMSSYGGRTGPGAGMPRRSDRSGCRRRARTCIAPGHPGMAAQRNTTVRWPLSRIRCSTCSRTARASTRDSMSLPMRIRAAGVIAWSTCATSCSMIGPSSRSAVT